LPIIATLRDIAKRIATFTDARGTLATMAVATLARMAPAVPDGYQLITEAARSRGVTRRTLERWIRDGRLKAVHVPGIRQWCVSEADLKRLFEPEP